MDKKEEKKEKLMKEIRVPPATKPISEKISKRSEKEAKEIAKKVLKRIEPFAEAIAEDVGVRFRFGGDPVSFFNPREGIINLGWGEFQDPRADELRGAAVIFHELGHLRHLLLDPDTILKSVKEIKPQIFYLYNACDDIEIEDYLKKYPPIREEREYEYKYVASTRDLSQEPKSSQFLFGLMEYAMLGEMPRGIDSEVRKKIVELTNVNGTDAIELLKTTQEPGLRHQIVKKIFQPVYEYFLEKDKKEGRVMNEIEEALQTVVILLGDGKLSEKEIKKINELKLGKIIKISERDLRKFIRDVERRKREEEKKRAPSQVAAGMTAAEYEITPNEAADYRSEYEEVKSYVSEVADSLEKIVDEHIQMTYGFTHPMKKGVVLEPGLLHEAYIAIKTGKEPAIFRKFEPIRKVKKVFPTEVVFYLLCDMSSSMSGEKERLQRLTTVLLMEGIAEYMRRVEEKRKSLGTNEAGFDIKVELRRFGSQDTPLKDKEEEFTPKIRIRVHKMLFDADEGATREDLSFEKILEKLNKLPSEEREKIRNKEKEHIVILLSDGASGNPEGSHRLIKNLRNMGVEVWGVGITKEAGEEMRELVGREYAIPLDDPKELPSAIATFVSKRIKLREVG